MENTIKNNNFNNGTGSLGKPLPVLILSKGLSESIKHHLTAQGVEVHHYEVSSDDEQNFFTKPVISKAIKYAKEQNFQLVLTIDPESNRISIAVRLEPDGKFRILSIHQLAVLVAHSIVQSGTAAKGIILKSFRISEMLERLAIKNQVRCINFLPDELYSMKKRLEDNGEEIILVVNENQEIHMGGDDSFLKILSTLINEEIMARKSNKTLFDKLIGLYQEFGFYKEKMLTVPLIQKSQFKHYENMMNMVRRSGPDSLPFGEIRMLTDYKKGRTRNYLTGKKMEIDSQSFNAVSISLSDGSSILMELSSNKMIYNIAVKGSLNSKDQFEIVNKSSKKQILKVLESLNRIQ
jgi:phosphoglucomutase